MEGWWSPVALGTSTNPVDLGLHQPAADLPKQLISPGDRPVCAISVPLAKAGIISIQMVLILLKKMAAKEWEWEREYTTGWWVDRNSQGDEMNE